MKRYSVIFLLIISAGIFLFSCQRELFFDTLASAGSLQDSSGDCLPKTIGGKYTAGINTGDTNFIEVSVHVTRAGSYNVVTDSVNGYSFKATGNFTDTGIYVVRLAAKGTPTAAGINTFIIRYDNSQCLVKVNVLIGSGGPLAPAVYTLQGAPGTCLPITVVGSYITDVALNSDDSVIVTLMVSVAGSYNLSTNELNRYKFFANGVVDTGLQKITLKGIGAPLNAGTDIVTVSGGGSACSFSITVNNPVIVTGTDYFPLTSNSYWTYDDLLNSGDTIKRVITDSVINSGFLYHIMHEYDRYGGDTSFMFRKSGNDYIQYGPVDILTTALKYVPEVLGTINFLKQNLLSGDNWMSDEYVGNLFSGQPVYLQYNFYCVDANTAISINGNSFINVYHIVLLPQVRSSLIYPYNSTNEQVDLFYAKGIGLVYLKATDNSGFRKKELKLKHWMIY